GKRRDDQRVEIVAVGQADDGALGVAVGKEIEIGLSRGVGLALARRVDVEELGLLHLHRRQRGVLEGLELGAARFGRWLERRRQAAARGQLIFFLFLLFVLFLVGRLLIEGFPLAGRLLFVTQQIEAGVGSL